MTVESTAARPHTYAALDGWRGISALLVALGNVSTTSHISALPLIANAHLFVDFFFVLSGFVITHAYQPRLSKASDAADMIWRRFARLWPLHAAMLAAFVALEIGVTVLTAVTGMERRGSWFNPGSNTLLVAIPTNLALLHSFGLHGQATWNFPSWSISAEFWTYVVFALVMTTAPRRSALVAGALAAFGAFVVMTRSHQLMDTSYDFGFFRCLYGFFVGHLVYLIRARDPIAGSSGTASELAVIALVALFVSLCASTPLAFAAPFVFGLAVWVFARQSGQISRLMCSPPLAALGAWSYSIYMVHALVLSIAIRALTIIGKKTGATLVSEIHTSPDTIMYLVSLGSPFAMDFVILVYLAIVLALAAQTRRYIEIPAQRTLNNFYATRTSAT